MQKFSILTEVPPELLNILQKQRRQNNLIKVYFCFVNKAQMSNLYIHILCDLKRISFVELLITD